MEDLRRKKRVPFTAVIEQLLRVRSDYPRLGGDDEFFTAKAQNLSSGGIGCETAAKIDPLSQVYLIFSLPTPEGSRSIRCEGYVAHSSLEGERCILGIRFSGLSAEDQSAIDAYVGAREQG